jgi:hypothetical protein
MLGNAGTFFARLLLAMLITFCAQSTVIAQNFAWHVGESSGEVWIMTSASRPAAPNDDASINPGNTIHTGRSGRVLLVRGTQTTLIAANSVVGIPEQQFEGSSSVVEQAGSILLDVEKRDGQHFEVLTPYLAAVAKGAQFRVTVDNSGAGVDVLSGQVEVTDYKTGQYTLVNAGQTARVLLQGPPGLTLSGAGTLSLIEPGVPRHSSVSPITIPDEGFSAPVRTENEQQGDASGERPENGKRGRGSMSKHRGQSAENAEGYGLIHSLFIRGKHVLGFDGRNDEDDVETPLLAPSDDRPSDQDLAFGLVAWVKGVVGLNSNKHVDDPVTPALVLPAVVGFFVAVVIGVLRRRKSKGASNKVAAAGNNDRVQQIASYRTRLKIRSET